MSPSSRLPLFVPFLVVVLALLAATATRAASKAETYTDPAGDAGETPDITTVVVAHDPPETVSFAVTIAQSQISDEGAIFLAVNTDADVATGWGDGTDVVVLMTGRSFDVARWNGTMFASAPAPSARLSVAANTLTIGFARTDLGVTGTRFAFSVAGMRIQNDRVAGIDPAPDGFAMWTYTFAPPSPQPPASPSPPATPPLTVGAGKATASPPPRAGKPTRVSMPFTRSDGRAPTGSVACVAKVASTPVRARGSLAGGRASCSLTIPAGSTGKTLAGTIRATVAGRVVKRAFSFRIG